MKISPLVLEYDVNAVSNQLRSQWIGRGEKVRELELKMAKWVGAKYAVALGSGTASLVVAINHVGLAVSHPVDVCDAVKIGVRYSRPGYGTQATISIYPDDSGDIVDFARHLPMRGEVQLKAKAAIFSFGALKDVSGGVGGCVVSNTEIDCEDYKKISPLSDINAAMILSQLNRYDGKSDYRRVADGTLWKLK